MSKLLKSTNGNYNYQFRWMNENGTDVGFNDVWAPNMKEARKEAKLMETKAHWALWDDGSNKYITVPNEVRGSGHCFRMKGMYINPKSFYRATAEDSRRMNRIGNMLSM